MVEGNAVQLFCLRKHHESSVAVGESFRLFMCRPLLPFSGDELPLFLFLALCLELSFQHPYAGYPMQGTV